MRAFAAVAAFFLVPVVAAPASAFEVGEPRRGARAIDVRIQALAERQREELGMPKEFFPFLEDDARVRTARYVWGDPTPDLTTDGGDDVLETDIRYRYQVGGGQDPLGTIEARSTTRITLRSGKTGQKIWMKRFPRDAYPFTMRLGRNGEHGVVVISGAWNFYATTEQSTLRFDAFDRKGKHLWSREYRSVSYYSLLNYVTEDALIAVSKFNGVRGRAEDLLFGLATTVSGPFTNTMMVRTLAIDGRDGSERVHPIVDIGVDWWPIPLPTRDLDGDGLDDYATTNKFGIDPGDPDAQEGPSIGGTVYARTGKMGMPIWTTSGLDMDIFGWTIGFTDVVGSDVPDVALQTYVARQTSVPLPIDLPFLGFTRFRPRVYLLEGEFGAKQWHETSEWIYTPGDIDGIGKPDIMLGRYRIRFRKNKTKLTQKAVNGFGQQLWKRRSIWHFETMPCPRDVCFGWGYGWIDPTPNYQPDRVNDSLFVQYVQQNEALEDHNTRAFDGRNGRLRFEDRSDAYIATAGVAIDDRGTDLVAFEYGGIGDKVRVEARDGWNRMLWGGMLGGPDGFVPRRAGFYAMGFYLSGDRCGDLVINGWERDESFYGVFDGGSGRRLWSRWTGPKADHPRISRLTDRNRAC